MGNRRDYIIQEIVNICQKIDQKAWVANHDGNISIKYDDQLLATPTSISKGDMARELVITLDYDGKKIDGLGKPFSEIKLHLAAYRYRNDIEAVLHAHPPFSTARGLIGIDFPINIPEAIVSLGDIVPVSSYAMPGSTDSVRAVEESLSRSDIFMMPGNGVLAVGRDLKEAYLRMELLEHLVKIDYYASAMGNALEIPEQDKQKLLSKRAALGLTMADSQPSQQKSPTISQSDILKELISKEIKKALESKK